MAAQGSKHEYYNEQHGNLIAFYDSARFKEKEILYGIMTYRHNTIYDIILYIHIMLL